MTDMTPSEGRGAPIARDGAAVARLTTGPDFLSPPPADFLGLDAPDAFFTDLEPSDGPSNQGGT